MNIVTQLIERIEQYRKTNANPCKSYKTEQKANEVAMQYAQQFADYFAVNGTQQPCRYIVVFNTAWNKWVIGFDFTELLSRKSSTGGYLGIASHYKFYTY